MFQRNGVTLQKIGGGSAIKVNFIALTLHYLCRRYTRLLGKAGNILAAARVIYIDQANA